jgi:hypothetical protein
MAGALLVAGLGVGFFAGVLLSMTCVRAAEAERVHAEAARDTAEQERDRAGFEVARLEGELAAERLVRAEFRREFCGWRPEFADPCVLPFPQRPKGVG